MAEKKPGFVGWNHLREVHGGAGRLKPYFDYPGKTYKRVLGYFVKDVEVGTKQRTIDENYPLFESKALGKELLVNKGILIGEKIRTMGASKFGTLYEVGLLSEDELATVEKELLEKNEVTHLLSREKVIQDCKGFSESWEYDVAGDLLSLIPNS